MPNDDKAENLNILPAGTVDDASTEIQFGEQDTKITETPDSLPVDVDIEHENGLIVENTKSNCKYATLEGATSTVEDNADTFLTKAESGAECSYTQLDTDAGEDVGSPVDRSVEEESGPRPCSVANVKLVPEAKHLSDLSSRNMPQNHDITFGSIIRNGNAVNSESMAYNLPVENDSVLLTSPDGDHKEASQEAEDIGVLLGNETLTLSPKHSTGDILDGHIVDMEVGKRPFYFLIRLPRSDEESLREQIKQAQIQVDENTRGRDAIRAEIQIKKATCKEYGQDIDAAISGERTARGFLKSKRQEMDAVQSVINRLKNAISVEDIDGRIRNMEHMIQHETLPLKEEKQIIREIKQLKQLREELSNNMGRQAEVQQSLDHKDNIEERLKHLQSLRKEIDGLRDNVLKAEAVTKAARKKYDDENDKLNTLLARFKAANDIRQESYAYLQGLRKQLYDKNKYFWKYKDDVKAANEIASKEDKEELQKFCINQVERTMELWNKNDEFRREYVKNNTRSTLRRLRTLDGRSLGPDEEPPIVPYAINERTVKSKSVSSPSTVEQKNEVVSLQADKIEDKPVVKVVVEQRNQTTKSKRPAKPAPSGYGLVRDSGRDEIEDVIEEPKRRKEEEELAQKAEELRKEEEAVKLKEQQRLEEIGKAKEALERKKRNAEKVQQRAALRAQKDAEQKEKEKEKRARKKERMKAASLETTNGINEGEPAPSSEAPTKTPEECDEKPITTIKKPVKPSQFKKLTKAKSVPLPIRNRSKKKMQSWMWVLIVALAGVALFLLGNSSFSLRSGLKGFGF
ncbi:Proton pump-interactor 1 [Quillaja saponaria]|nr:Proton pump-interactor 1 [Quillaja saponaria]